MDLSGRVAVVTGGTSGIGRALVAALAGAGADVVPTARRAELVDEAASEVESLGRRTLRLTSDVGERSSLEAVRARTLEELGRIDILVNAAGMTRRVSSIEADEEYWRQILDTNFMGTVRACQVFAVPMLERGWGRIVNIASLATFVALKEVAAYSASKAAVGSLTKSLAIELGPRGVNVNAIAPGVFPTDLNRSIIEGTPRGRELLMRTPLGRFGKVEELGGAAVFLASEAASYVNGEVLAVDGGFLASGVNQ